MSNAMKLLDELEAGMAREDDRLLDEFRDRYPERVKAIDTLREVLLFIDSAEALGDDVEPDDIRWIITAGLESE